MNRRVCARPAWARLAWACPDRAAVAEFETTAARREFSSLSNSAGIGRGLARWSTLVEGVVAADAMGRIGRFGPGALARDCCSLPRGAVAQEGSAGRRTGGFPGGVRDGDSLPVIPRPARAAASRAEVPSLRRTRGSPGLVGHGLPERTGRRGIDGEYHQNASTFPADLVRHNRLAARSGLPRAGLPAGSAALLWSDYQILTCWSAGRKSLSPCLTPKAW